MLIRRAISICKTQHGRAKRQGKSDSLGEGESGRDADCNNKKKDAVVVGAARPKTGGLGVLNKEVTDNFLTRCTNMNISHG